MKKTVTTIKNSKKNAVTKPKFLFSHFFIFSTELIIFKELIKNFLHCLMSSVWGSTKIVIPHQQKYYFTMLDHWKKPRQI